MNKFLPPLLLLAASVYFQWYEADYAPTEIFSTWRTGTEHRLLTLYQGTAKNAVDGYFQNSKSGRVEGIVKSSYYESILTGHLLKAKNTNKCSSKKYGTYHWGKFRLKLSKTSFKGQWSYCAEELGGSWNGRN